MTESKPIKRTLTMSLDSKEARDILNALERREPLTPASPIWPFVKALLAIRDGKTIIMNS